MKIKILYTLFIFFVCMTACNSSKDTINSEKIFKIDSNVFPVIVKYFLQNTNKSVRVDPTPLQTDSTLTKKEWDNWVSSREDIAQNRLKMLQKLQVDLGDAKLYQKCQFPSALLPPTPERLEGEKLVTGHDCEDFVDVQLIQISLPADSEKDYRFKHVAVVKFLNYGYMHFDIELYINNEKWQVVKIDTLGWILS